MSDISPLITNNSQFLPYEPSAKFPSAPKDVCLNPHGSMRSESAGDPVAAACQDFEAVLVNYLLKTMRQSVPKEGWLDGGNDTDFYQGLMDWEVATQASRQDRFGLWKTLYRQITGHEPGKMPENSNNNGAANPSVINEIPGGPHEIRVERIANHNVRGTGSGSTAVPAPETPGIPDPSESIQRPVGVDAAGQ